MAKPRQPPNKKSGSSSAAAQAFYDLTSDVRVQTVDQARDIYNRFVTDNVQRSYTFSQTRNQLEGGRPYDPQAQEAQGAGWQCNVNFGDAQAQRDKTFLPYWKMVNEVPRKANFDVETTNPKGPQWNAAFSECFDMFIDDWGADYFTQFMSACKNYVDFGPMMLQFLDQKDNPRYKNVNVQRLYFPKNAHMSPDSWTVMAFTQDIDAAYFYELVRNKKEEQKSRDAGWDIDSVKGAIVQMADGGTMPDFRDYTRWNDWLVNNDVQFSTPEQALPCVYLYVKNYDGKIGCYCFTQQGGVENFLFKDHSFSDNFRQILAPVWYDTGNDAMVHSIKGFGIKNYFFASLMNQMKSRLCDATALASGINFQYNQEGTPEETPPVENFGPFTIFPSNMQQLAVYPQIQPSIAAIQMLDANAANNNALYKDTSQQQIEQTDTATQAKILASMQGQLSEATAAIFLSQLADNVYKEQVRRLRRKGNTNDDAKEFVRRLRERGVPDKVIFESNIRVKTGANASLANPALLEMKFQQALALSKLPGVNQRFFLESYIAYAFGSQAVSKALLPEGVNSNPAQRREAIEENYFFGQGAVIPVAPEDAHFEHIQEHLKPLSAVGQQFQQSQQLSPDQLVLLTLGLEHTGQHMAYLEQDETAKDQFQQVLGPFRALQAVAQKAIKMTQQQQQPQMAALPAA